MQIGPRERSATRLDKLVRLTEQSPSTAPTPGHDTTVNPRIWKSLDSASTLSSWLGADAVLRIPLRKAARQGLVQWLPAQASPIQKGPKLTHMHHVVCVCVAGSGRDCPRLAALLDARPTKPSAMACGEGECALFREGQLLVRSGHASLFMWHLSQTASGVAFSRCHPLACLRTRGALRPLCYGCERGPSFDGNHPPGWRSQSVAGSQPRETAWATPMA